MKFKYIFPLIFLLISSCNNGNSSLLSSFSSFSDAQSDVPYSESETNSSSIPSSSFSSSSSTSSEFSSSSESINKLTIKEIKEIGETFIGKENNVGVYESNYQVEIDLTLLACLDAITSKTGYGDRYKILMTDGNDYIYIKTNNENYQYLKKYVQNKGLYKIQGNISLYNKEIEITVNDKPQYLNIDNLGLINFDNFSSLLTLEEVYEEINKLTLNTKGVAFSKIVKIHSKCLAKDINNTNLFFGNGDYIINVHGDDKVTNKFNEDKDYTLYGALSMHNFRPSLEYVHHSNLDEKVNVDFTNIESKKAEDFYEYTYEVDEEKTYPNYTNLFKHPFKVEGYLNFYMKSNKYYTVIESTLKQEIYNTYQNAKYNKTLMIVNENLVGLDTFKYFPFVEEYENGEKIEFIVFPYLWNNQEYPQIYLYY